MNKNIKDWFKIATLIWIISMIVFYLIAPYLPFVKPVPDINVVRLFLMVFSTANYGGLLFAAFVSFRIEHKEVPKP